MKHTILIWNAATIRIVRVDMENDDDVEILVEGLREEMKVEDEWQILDGHPVVDSNTQRP